MGVTMAEVFSFSKNVLVVLVHCKHNLWIRNVPRFDVIIVSSDAVAKVVNEVEGLVGEVPAQPRRLPAPGEACRPLRNGTENPAFYSSKDWLAPSQQTAFP